MAFRDALPRVSPSSESDRRLANCMKRYYTGVRPTRIYSVFVVDDEQVISSTLAVILGRNGFSATAFTNPVAALKESETDPPSLLISDVVMLEMSGIELASDFAKFHRRQRFYFFPARPPLARCWRMLGNQDRTSLF
jgi:PleD family two-component response regulator